MRRFTLVTALVAATLLTSAASPSVATQIPVWVDVSDDFLVNIGEVVRVCQPELDRVLPGLGFKLVPGRAVPVVCTGNTPSDRAEYSAWYWGDNLSHAERGLRVLLLPNGSPGGDAPRLGLRVGPGSAMTAAVVGTFWDSGSLGQQLVCQRLAHEVAGHIVGDLPDGGTGIMGYEVGPGATWAPGQVSQIAGNIPAIETELRSRGVCIPGDQALCFGGGRFNVTMTWRFQNGQTGNGQAVPLTDQAGTFYFNNPNNLEVLVKLVNGCPVNGSYWIFYAATTSVEFQIVVTDTQTGNINTYSNVLGTAAPPIQDTAAFACP